MSHRTRMPLVRIAALVAVLAGGAITVPAAATDRVVVVQPGDTLSEIALKHGVTVAQLRALNGIANPNRIYAGQRLRVTGTAPTPSAASTPKAKAVVHVVAWGENLTGIARRYGSTIKAIAKANGIANPSFLRVGQRLTIPGTAASAKAPAPAAGATSAARAPASKVHVVAWGENLTGIARRYGSTISAIAAARCFARSTRMSQALTSSTCGDFDRCGKYCDDTLPQPITPTRVRARWTRATPSSDETRDATPAIAVRCRNSCREIGGMAHSPRSVIAGSVAAARSAGDACSIANTAGEISAPGMRPTIAVARIAVKRGGRATTSGEPQPP